MTFHAELNGNGYLKVGGTMRAESCFTSLAKFGINIGFYPFCQSEGNSRQRSSMKSIRPFNMNIL